jgi:hypothetical protein
VFAIGTFTNRIGKHVPIYSLHFGKC